MDQARYIIIIGCGRLGSLLANRLSGLGHRVVVIDRNEAALEKLTAEFSGFQIVGDAVEWRSCVRLKWNRPTIF